MDIDVMAMMVKNWADDAFPNRTDQSMYLKMYSEMGEMIDATTPEGVEDEIADVLIMLLDFAKRRNIRISQAVLNKLEVNRKRVWVQSESGVFRHDDGTQSNGGLALARVVLEASRHISDQPANPTMTRDELVAAAESIGMRLLAPVAQPDDMRNAFTTPLMWHAWQAAQKANAPGGALVGESDAKAGPGLAGVDFTCVHDFVVQPSSGIKLCAHCGLSEVAAHKPAAPAPVAQPAAWCDLADGETVRRGDRLLSAGKRWVEVDERLIGLQYNAKSWHPVQRPAAPAPVALTPAQQHADALLEALRDLLALVVFSDHDVALSMGELAAVESAKTVLAAIDAAAPAPVAQGDSKENSGE